ncbi:hypothetical protein CS8_096600 [Cupriavidus sp. 8B]
MAPIKRVAWLRAPLESGQSPLTVLSLQSELPGAAESNRERENSRVAQDVFQQPVKLLVVNCQYCQELHFLHSE